MMLTNVALYFMMHVFIAHSLQILDDKSRLLERSRLNRSSLPILGREDSGEMMETGEEVV